MYPDVYYMPEWGKLNEALDKGEFHLYDFLCKYGRIIYPYIKRKTPFCYKNEYYYDTVTPYGFNGPCIIEASDRANLFKAYAAAFKEHCEKEKIIAEYVRFSPWLKNAEDFATFYEIQNNNFTFYIDLEEGNYFESCFSSKCRNQIRKALKNGVSVVFADGLEKVDEFYALYIKMLEKNNVGEYYKFAKEYIENTIKAMQGHIITAIAYYENVPISGALFLYDDLNMHYHLSGNDKNYGNLCGNNLLIYEAANIAYGKGIKKLHLGGVAKEESGLFHFKQSFAKDGLLPFLVGKRVDNEEIYNIMVEMSSCKNGNYFPAYRG